MTFQHQTANGGIISLSEMSDKHLLNTLKFLQRRAREGVVLRYGGGAEDNDIWYEEEHLNYEDSLLHLNYKVYEDEAKRRNLPLPKGAPMHLDTIYLQDSPLNVGLTKGKKRLLIQGAWDTDFELSLKKDEVTALIHDLTLYLLFMK